MPDEDLVQSKVNTQTLLPARKPTEETLQVPPEPLSLQLPDVSQPDLQPATSSSVLAPVSTRSGRWDLLKSAISPPSNIMQRLFEQFWKVNTLLDLFCLIKCPSVYCLPYRTFISLFCLFKKGDVTILLSFALRACTVWDVTRMYLLH